MLAVESFGRPPIPARRQPTSNNGSICTAKIPWPVMRVCHTANRSALPLPRKCRMRLSTFSLRSGKCIGQPLLEQRRDCPRQSHNEYTRESRAGVRCRFENRGNLVIRRVRESPARPSRPPASRRRQVAQSHRQARRRRRRSRLQDPLQFWIERGHGNVYRRGTVAGQFGREDPHRA